MFILEWLIVLELAINSRLVGLAVTWVLGPTLPVRAAGSNGRCNTIESVDPTMLHLREPISPAALNQT